MRTLVIDPAVLAGASRLQVDAFGRQIQDAQRQHPGLFSETTQDGGRLAGLPHVPSRLDQHERAATGPLGAVLDAVKVNHRLAVAKEEPVPLRVDQRPGAVPLVPAQLMRSLVVATAAASMSQPMNRRPRSRHTTAVVPHPRYVSVTSVTCSDNLHPC